MRNLFTWGGAALLAALPTSASAQTNWQTVVMNDNGSGYCITSDAAGNVFVGGFASGPSGSAIESGLVFGTTTRDETSWYLSDDSNTNATGGDSTTLRDLAFDSNSNLWSAGLLLEPSGSYWYVRMSSGPAAGTNSWRTMDKFRYSGNSSSAASVVGDSSGNVYVAGSAGDYWLVRKGTFSSADHAWTWTTVDAFNGGGNGSDPRAIALAPPSRDAPNGALCVVGATREPDRDIALVRRSVDGGATWETVNAFPSNSGWTAATAVCSDASGKVYVVGASQIPATNGETFREEWLVRRSQDAGATWQTVDTYADAGEYAAPESICLDPAGNPVVAGFSTGSDDHYHWVVRRPINGTWTTVDYYPALGTGSYAQAWGVTLDAAGNLLVTGDASDGPGIDHWIVRSARLAAPPTTIRAFVSGHTLNLSAPTVAGHTYVLEYKDSLADPAWTALASQPGDGSPVVFTDDTTAQPARFYRIRVQ
jgi:hypothetical protein